MPNNFLEDPTNTQNYNRYAYVNFNPLSWVDWAGEQAEPPKYIDLETVVVFAIRKKSATIYIYVYDNPYSGWGDGNYFPTIESGGGSGGEGSSQQVTAGKNKDQTFNTIGTTSTLTSVVPVTVSSATKLISKTPAYTKDIARIANVAGRTSTGLGLISVGATYANYKMGNVSEGRYYAQQAINVIGFFGPWGAGIAIGLTIADTAYGDKLEKWIRER